MTRTWALSAVPGKYKTFISTLIATNLSESCNSFRPRQDPHFPLNPLFIEAKISQKL